MYIEPPIEILFAECVKPFPFASGIHNLSPVVSGAILRTGEA